MSTISFGDAKALDALNPRTTREAGEGNTEPVSARTSRRYLRRLTHPLRHR